MFLSVLMMNDIDLYKITITKKIKYNCDIIMLFDIKI